MSAWNVEGQLDALKDSRIMMVDDEPTTMDVLEAFLEGEGYSNFVRTTDSRQALGLLAVEKPDVLLLDLMMPHVGGLEILAAMRKDETLKQVPVIILTSSTDSETKLKALELEAADFLGKPVDPSELALRLRNTLAAKAYRDRLAYYDGVTGLPNLRLFLEGSDRLLRRADTAAQQCAVLHVQLDRFNQINDTLGHEIGDVLLKAIAQRLEQCVRVGDLLLSRDAEGGTLSRVGRDEFTLFLPGVGSADAAARVARRILAGLSEPFSVDGHDLFVNYGIGVALFPEDGNDVETLLRHARMCHEHQTERNSYQFYSKSLNARSLERLALENQLRKALERKELVLYYQPKVDVKTGLIVGAEALMRWQHPELGLVPPGRFIPIAEETGLIVAIGEWTLRAACQQTKAWQDAGLPRVHMAVNVSSQQFLDGTLPETVRECLESSGLDGEYLTLELTEGTIMQNPEEASEMLRQIKQMNPKLSIDDFGTGYSSLSYLTRFPLDELKIDRSFVSNLDGEGEGEAIVGAIIAMARSLGLTVVAEGVETPEQLAFLTERGCDEYQGFFFSKPVPVTEWTVLLESKGRS